MTLGMLTCCRGVAAASVHGKPRGLRSPLRAFIRAS